MATTDIPASEAGTDMAVDADQLGSSDIAVGVDRLGPSDMAVGTETMGSEIWDPGTTDMDLGTMDGTEPATTDMAEPGVTDIADEDLATFPSLSERRSNGREQECMRI